MSENESWAPPTADGASRPPVPPQPAAAPAATPAPQAAGAYPPPPPGAYAPPQYAPPPPQYGQYAPPPPPGQYGQYAPPLPPGQYAPPPPGQYAPPPYGQYSAPPPGYAQPGASVPYWAQQPQGYPQPGPAQWAPPPKPGLIPLRPLGFGTLMAAPFQVLRRNPKATFGSGLIVQLVVGLVTVLFVGAATVWAFSRVFSASPADQDTVGAGSLAIIGLSTLIPLALSLFASALLQAVLVVEVARGTLGEKRRLGELWRVAFRRILPITGWYALIALAVVIAIGLIVLAAVAISTLGTAGIVVGVLLAVFLGLGGIVLGAWLGTKLALVPCVIVLERLGVFASIRRSWQLTKGNFWRTLGVIWLVSIILSFAGQLLSVPFQFLLPIAITVIDPNNSGSGIVAAGVIYLLFLAFSLVLSAVTSVVQAATVAVVYIDLRMRTEGLDIELARFVESRQAGDESWPDPYLPQPRG